MQIVSFFSKEFKVRLIESFLDQYLTLKCYLLRDGIVYDPNLHIYLENFKYTHNSLLSFSNSSLLLNTPLLDPPNFVPNNRITLTDGTNTHGPFKIVQVIDLNTIQIANLDGTPVTNLSLSSNVYSINSNDLLFDVGGNEVAPVLITQYEINPNNSLTDIELIFDDIIFTPTTYNYNPTSGMIIVASDGSENVIVSATMFLSPITITTSDSLTFYAPVLRV